MANKFQNPNLVIKNGVFLLFRMLFVLFLGFFATRLTLQVLGDEKFGIYNIVGGIIAIFAIISLPIRDSLQRFFNVEFANEEYSPDVVFSTSVRIVRLMIIVITVLYETVGLFIINFIIQYPENEQIAVNIIFQICALANIFAFAELPYMSLLFSRENMGVPAFCEIGQSILKIVLLFLIPLIPVDVLIPYASIYLFTNALIYSFYSIYCRKKYLDCFVSRKTDKILQKNMMTFSGWSFVEAVAGIALTYISNIFINVFGGVLYNTAYGITKQLQNGVIGFSSNVLKASDPQITSSTTTKNIGYRDQLVMTTVKVCFLFTAFVYVVFYFDGELLLGIWLGKIPQYVLKFCEIMLLTLVFNSMTLPFRTTIMATGKVKGYFLSYGIVSLISMILMFVLLKMQFPVIVVMYIIMGSTAMMLFIAMAFSKKEAGINIAYFIKNIIPSVAVVLMAWIVYFLIKKTFISDLVGFIMASMISAIVLCVMAYILALNNAEKNKVKQIINKVTSIIKK